MTQPSPAPAPPKKAIARLRKRRQPSPPSPAKTLLLVFSIFLIFTLSFLYSKLGSNFRDLLNQLYSPFGILIILFLALEYIVLKGRDRSRILHIELEHARQKRQADLAYLRGLDGELTRMLEKLRRMEDEMESDTASPAASDFRPAIHAVREDIARLQRDLSERF